MAFCHTSPALRLPPLDRAAGSWLVLGAILSLGLFLRLQQITGQWLMDDEWHAVHKLIASDGYLPILSSFGRADYSIPLTAFYKLLADTVGLSELRMRLPMLAAGALFLVLAMAWARTRLGGAVAAGFGFLLAVSPLLVNYSRNARPYMLTLLLGAVAVWALARWLRDADRRHAALYLACAWLASWLHLIMAPFVLAPLLVAAIACLAGTAGVRFAHLAGLGLAAAGGVAAAVLPPLLNDWSAMTEKTGADLPGLDTLLGVGHVWLGTGSGAVVLLGLGLAAAGLPALRRAAPLELAMWLAGLAAILAAILAMRPAWVHNPLTFGRYLLPALPFLLLLIAAGIAAVARRLPTPTAFLAIVALPAAFLVGTPHAALLQRPNAFTLHSYYQFDYRKSHNPVRVAFAPFRAPSPFWDRFREADPGRHVIAVTGQAGFESYFNLQPLYQPRHRQRLVNLQTSRACGPERLGEAFPDQGVHLRNAASLAIPGDLAAKGVDWIIVDRRLERAARLPGQQTGGDDQDRCQEYLIDRFGPPAYADDALTAFHIGDNPGLDTGLVPH